jgi:oligopeptide transport system permease protein
VLSKAIKGAEVSIIVGLLAACRHPHRHVLGASAGFFGGKIGDFLEWVYNVFTAIPSILLIFAFAAIVQRGVLSVVLILGADRLDRHLPPDARRVHEAPVREYVRSAEAIGASQMSRMFKHILPNVSHVALVQLSPACGRFIKSEVILSYLGLGVASTRSAGAPCWPKRRAS